MNTPVKFQLAKLLKEKGWNKPELNFYFEDGTFSENVFRDSVGMDYGSQFEVGFSELIENWNDKWLTKKNGDRCFGCDKSRGYFETFSAPTIAEVVMWLYEKHGIWIDVYYNSKYKSWDYEYTNINWSQEEVDKKLEEDIHNLLDNIFNAKIKYNSPTEAYEAAIEFTLKNLI